MQNFALFRSRDFDKNFESYVIISLDAQNHSSNQSRAVSLDLTGKYLMTPDEIGFERKDKSILKNGQKLTEVALKISKYIVREEEGVSKLMITLDKSQRTYTDNNVIKGKTYIYQITPVDLSGKKEIEANQF